MKEEKGLEKHLFPRLLPPRRVMFRECYISYLWDFIQFNTRELILFQT